MTIAKENEEKKRYLNGYRDCKRRAARLSRQIAELRSQQMFPSMENDGMPHGNTHSDLSAYAVRLDELIWQLERERASAVRQYQEIYDRIHSLSEGAEKEVLVRRYLLMETWETIAAQMHYTRRHITRLHGRALRSFCLPERMS